MINHFSCGSTVVHFGVIYECHVKFNEVLVEMLCLKDYMSFIISHIFITMGLERAYQ